MLRRTTTILALAVGALAAGLVVTGQSGVDHLRLADSRGSHVSSFTVGQLGSKTVTPAKPVSVTPAKPVPGIPQLAQSRTVQLKELSPTQAKSLIGTVPKGSFAGSSNLTVTTGKTPDAYCSKSGGSGWNPFDLPYDFNITGKAFYRTIPSAPGYLEWYLFEYELGGSPQIHSNVRIVMQEGLDTKFQYDSPDDRHYGLTYYLQPSTSVITRATTSVNVDFRAIFDRPTGSDPSCTAHTARI